MASAMDEDFIWKWWLERTVHHYRARGWDAQTAADLASEAVIRLWQAQQRGIRLTSAYWRATVQSVERDYGRYLQRQTRIYQQMGTQSAPELPTDPEKQALQHLWYEHCLNSLSSREQQVVRAHLEGQYTFEEIAQQLDSRADRVRKTYQRAIAKLRQNTQEESA